MNAFSINVTVEPDSPGCTHRISSVNGMPILTKRRALSKLKSVEQRCTFVLLLFFALLIAAPSQLFADGALVDPGTTYHFTSADNCDCSGTPYHDGVWATYSLCDYDRNRAEAGAMLAVSAINIDTTAFDTLHTCFYVPGSKPTVLDATVSANINWDGVLFGAGVLGAGASVTIDMFLVDKTDNVIKASTRVMQKAQDSAGLKGIDVGGTHVSGSQGVSMQGTVVRGHQYAIQLRVTTSAETGLVGVSVGSIFAENVFGLGLGDHYVKWTQLAITVNDDISEKLDQLLQGQEEIEKLLKTPQGRRPGFPLKRY